MSERDPSIESTLDLLNTGAKVSLFFGRADDPRWLKPAIERGHFAQPPSAIREGNSIRFVGWPQAEFLARVAERAEPEVVLAAIREVRLTDDVIIYTNLLRALSFLPARVAVEAVDQVSDWIGVPLSGRFIFQEVAGLVVRFAEGGFSNAGLVLAQHLLKPVGPRPPKEAELHGAKVEIRQEPEALLDPWEFDRFLETALPALIAHSSMATSEMLAEILDDYLVAEFGVEAREKERDISYIWCREVEGAAERPAYEYKQVLVPWLRDASIAVARTGAGACRQVMETLRSYPWPVHSRVALITAASVADAAPDVASALLLDRSLFDGLEYRHEYAVLAKHAFSLLNEEQRDTVLTWIEEGPSFDADDDRKERWRRDRLTAVIDHLPEAWRERYDQDVEKFGEPDWQADHLTGPTELWTGPTSPITEGELAERSVSEVIAYLEHWEPPREWHAPTREGLGRVVMADVQARPAQYAVEAAAFGDLDPTYARNLIGGLRAGVSQLQGVDLGPVFELALRVVEGRVPLPQRVQDALDLDEDRDWRGSRLELGHLFEALAKSNLIDASHDAIAVRCVAALLDDADPTVDNEARYGDGMGAINYSINTVRGQAVHAAAVLLAGLVGARRTGTEAAAELRAALLKRLDPTVEQSVAVRAALGIYYAQLVAAGVDDGSLLSARIFTADAQGREAWAAFLRFNTLSGQTVDSVWPILSSALTSGEWIRSDNSLSQSLRLAASLFVAGYRDAEVALLLWDGWGHASSNLRAGVIFGVSQVLQSSLDRAEVPVRVAELVDGILDFEDRHLAARSDERRSDLEALGTILVSQRMSIEWTLRALQRLLGLGSLPTDIEGVVARLAEAMVRDDLQEGILDCLEEIAGIDTQNWGVYAAHEPIAAIIQAGRASTTAATRERAEALVSRLLAANRFNPDWLS